MVIDEDKEHYLKVFELDPERPNVLVNMQRAVYDKFTKKFGKVMWLAERAGNLDGEAAKVTDLFFSGKLINKGTNNQSHPQSNSIPYS